MSIYSFMVFLQFLRKDFYTYRHRLLRYALNYSVIYSLIYAFSMVYLQSSLYFPGGNTYKGTMLFVGSTLITILVFANKITVPLLYDFEQDRYIDYQITLLSPQLVLLERIFFTSVFSFLVLLLYFPLAKLFFRNYFVTTHTSWPLFFLILYLSCLLCASYSMFIVCYLKHSSSLARVWRLVNSNLIFLLGGTFLPWHIINQFSSILGGIALLNPFLYITEGLRRATLQSPEFFSIPSCIAALVIGIVGFTVASFYAFKKKIDHI